MIGLSFMKNFKQKRAPQNYKKSCAYNIMEFEKTEFLTMRTEELNTLIKHLDAIIAKYRSSDDFVMPYYIDFQFLDALFGSGRLNQMDLIPNKDTWEKLQKERDTFEIFGEKLLYKKENGKTKLCFHHKDACFVTIEHIQKLEMFKMLCSSLLEIKNSRKVIEQEQKKIERLSKLIK
jgi:hypothetical protein